MIVEGDSVVPIRVAMRPLSYVLDPYGWSSLTVPMTPALKRTEWERLGLKYTSLVVINTTEERRIATEADVEELCHYLARTPSFFLQVFRFEGAQLDVTSDDSGTSAFFLDADRGVKLITLDPTCLDETPFIRKVDAVVDLNEETERRHIVARDTGLRILRSFLAQETPVEMVAWPLSSDQWR